jgi:hypothetical protein
MHPLGPAEMAILIALLVLPVMGIVDASLLPSSAFRSAGRSKLLWILAQVFLGYVGAVIYLAAIRPEVRFFSAAPSPDWEEVADEQAADEEADDEEADDEEAADEEAGDRLPGDLGTGD